MKSKNIIVSVLGLIALAIAATPIQQAYAHGDRQQSPAWEYRSLYNDSWNYSDYTTHLNELGQNGWELSVYEPSTGRFWLKRRKQ